MRACTKCGAEKPLEDFYAHPYGLEGRQSACKECAKAAVRSNRAKRIEYYQAYDRIRANQTHRVEARAEYARANPKARPERDPQKRAARIAVGNALRSAALIRPPVCEVCHTHCEPHAHHDDYSKPLDVIWVCRPCHALIHAYWRAQERKAA